LEEHADCISRVGVNRDTGRQVVPQTHDRGKRNYDLQQANRNSEHHLTYTVKMEAAFISETSAIQPTSTCTNTEHED
jgi:hypothetical protein